jgi:hypothetical protein
MAILKLEPDEILPNTPALLEGEASGPFPIFWRGEIRDILLRAVQINRKKHVIFGCEVGNEMAGNWLLFDSKILMPVIWTSAPSQKTLENTALEFVVRGWELGHFFTLTDIRRKESIRVLLLGNNVGKWFDVHVEFRTRATFDFDAPFSFIGADRSEIQSFWQREMADVDSAVGFSARFASLDSDGRVDLIFGERRRELEQVMEWVLRCEPLLWKCGSEWDWKLGPKIADFSYLFCPFVDNFENFAVNLPFIYAMGRFLSEEHIPKLTKSLCGKHRCVRDFLESEPVWIHHFSKTPTAHEKVETAIQLRKWLRDNNAPAEIETLLNRNFQ